MPPGRTIQAVDAVSLIPSGNKPLKLHPDEKTLEHPLYDDLVMNVAMDGPLPSISDLMDKYHGESGHDDEMTW